MSQFPRSLVSPRRRKISRSVFSIRFRASLAVSLAALIFASPFNFAVSARTTTARSESLKTAGNSSNLTAAHNHKGGEAGHTGEEMDRFFVKMVNGEPTCFDATFEEAPIATQNNPNDPGVPVRDLPQSEKPRTDSVQNYSSAKSDGVDEVGGAGTLNINYIELSQLQTDPDRAKVIAAFERAAAVWTNRIKNPVTIVINIDYGNLTPNCTPTPTVPCTFDSSTLAAAGSSTTSRDYPGVRQNLLASSSSAEETAIYNALPASVVPTDTGNGGVVRANLSVGKALGLTTSTSTVATIGFNKKFPYDFNPDDGITQGETDFVAVATHELGHALGFTSGASESSTGVMRIWDLFRFRSGMTLANFTTAQRIMSVGGPSGNPDQVYFTGQAFKIGFNSEIDATELRLSTGGPEGVTTNNGDGRQSSHWKTNANGPNYIGIMNPTIGSSVIRLATENDFKALETIGWNLISSVAPPPAPAAPSPPANDNFANAQTLSGCSGSALGTNVGATKQTGEPNNPDSPASTKSVWYQWTAPSTGSVTLDTRTSGFDTVLAVYTGNSVGTLSPLANNDDTDDPATTESEVSSVVTFPATQGTTYRIEVNGFNNQGSLGDIGSFKLNWAQTGCSQQSAPTVQLSQTTLQIGEGGGNAQVIVSRTNATAAANVDYATSDSSGLTPCSSVTGIASSRCDYATSIGTLRFAAGEDTKTIYIPIIDDNITDGSESFTVILSNPSGATLGTATSSTVTITDNANTAGNPVDQAEFFIREHYIDFLGREPEPAGLAGWLNVYNNCGTTVAQPCDRIEISSAFFRSPEFQDRAYFIYRFYSAVGKIPLYEGFMPDFAKVSGFLSAQELEANKVAFVNEFMTRADYQNLYGSIGGNDAYVTALLNTLGLPNHSRKAEWINALNGGATRAVVLRSVTEDGQVYSKYYNESFVIMQYFGYLRRSADISYLSWIQLMNSNGGNYREMINGFLNSAEYRNRFQ